MKQKINLKEYLELGGKLENIKPETAWTTYLDRNLNCFAQSVKLGGRNTHAFHQAGQLYIVTYTNGNQKQYGSSWIEVEVEFVLAERFLKEN